MVKYYSHGHNGHDKCQIKSNLFKNFSKQIIAIFIFIVILTL